MTFFEDINYQGYDTQKKALANKLGDVSKVYRVSFPQLFTPENEYLDTINTAIQDICTKIIAIKSEYEVAIQQSVFLQKKHIKYTPNDKDDFFEKQKKIFYRSIPQKITDIYFTVTVKSPRCKERNLIFNIFNKYRDKIIDVSKFNENFYIFFQTVNTILFSKLSSIDVITINEISLEDLNTLIYDKYFNLDFSLEDSERKTIRSFVSNPYKNYVHIGNKMMVTYSLAHDGIRGQHNEHTKNQDILQEVKNKAYNNEITQSMFSDLILGNYNTEKIVTSIIYLKNIDATVKDIYANAKLQIADKSKNKNFTKLSFDQLNKDTVVCTHTSISLLGNPKNEKQFFKNCEEFENYINNYGFDLTINYRNNVQKYYNLSIGNTHNIPNYERNLLPIQYASRFFLYESLENSKNSLKGIHLKQRFSNNDYFLDLLKLNTNNKNIVLFGVSGTGKSVTIGYFIDSLYKDGHTIYLTDIGFSQKNLCKKLNGLYIEITPENPIKLNPFAILDDEDNDSSTFLTNLFFTCWKGGQEHMTTNEETVIGKTIVKYQTYCQKQQKKLNFQDYYYYTKKLFEKDKVFQTLKQNTFNKESYLLVMSDYLKKDDHNENNGKYYYLFDDDNRFSKQITENRFVIFEFEKIIDNERISNISSFLLNNIIKNKMLSNKRQNKQLIYIKDECHKFIQSKGQINQATFTELEYSFRTFRKHDATICIASQNIRDLDQHEKGKTIIENSSIKILKKQPSNQKNDIRDALSLSENSMKKLFSINENNKKKSVFIDIEDKSAVYDILLDDYNLMLARTDKMSREKINEELNKTNNIVLAVKNTVKQQ